MDFSIFESAYDNATEAIANLREAAEDIKNRMDDIIDACETLEIDL